MQTEYEDLLLKYETQVTFFPYVSCNTFVWFVPHTCVFILMQRIISDVQIDCLNKKLEEVDLFHDLTCDECAKYHANNHYGDKSVSLRESEAISVIKQLQEKVFPSILSMLLYCLQLCLLFY